MPDIVFDSLDSVPEGLKEHAKETNGKFTVKVVPQVKLDEFRDRNTTIAKENDAIKLVMSKVAPVIGDDPDAFVTRFGELTAMAQQVQDGKLKGTDAIEAAVTNRVAEMKSGFERQLTEAKTLQTAAEQKATAFDQKFRRSLVDRAVTDAVLNDASGALPGALPDILGRAYGVFQVSDDNRLVAMDGAAPIYGADGASPMSPLEWMGKLREQAPYFFKNSNGGGAAGGNGNDNYGGMSKADFDKLKPSQQLAMANKMAAAKR